MNYLSGASGTRTVNERLGTQGMLEERPDGPLHAVDPSTGQSLCRAEIQKIFHEIDWASTDKMKCSRCLSAAT
jgi:hypothetical protein